VESKAASDALQDGDHVELDFDRAQIVSKHGTHALPAPPGFVREIWKTGGIVPYFKEHGRFPGDDI
jgi:methanogen homoaconitase small subunit